MSLILLDIDGTLVGPNGDVDDVVWAAAERARQAGLRLAVCTGRTHAGVALEIAERLDADAPHIFHNGALVTAATGDVLDSRPLPDEAIAELIGHARRLDADSAGVIDPEYEATLELYTPAAIFVDRMTPRCARHAEVLDISAIERDLDEVRRREEVIRAHWILAPSMLSEMRGLEISGCAASSATSPALPDSVFISVTHHTACKGAGAAFAADDLGVDLCDVTGVGDSDSDVPMLERVGHPFVMGDADPALRTRFPTVGSVAAHGVIEALDFARCRLEEPFAGE